MGFKYKVSSDGIYFMTVTVIDWIDVFTGMIDQKPDYSHSNPVTAGIVYEPEH